MKRRSALRGGSLWRRLVAIVAAFSLVAAYLPAGAVSAADSGAAAGTGFTVQINETVTNGFTHPGVGVTKAVLENMRTQVLAQKEPWYSYYKAMTVSAAASKTATSSNQNAADPSKPASDAFNSQGFNSRFIADGLKAYTQALMYYITSDETYRANAMRIIRIWEQMDPAKFQYFTDAHIHVGIPLNRMMTAAEILRYSTYQTPELAWTDKDTADLTNNLINPAIQTFEYDNSWFMNQNNYALMGAMAGYIFTNNREGYNQRVEWFTVNKTAKDQGFNGSIKQLFRSIDTNAATGEKLDKPVVQQVEMGRDQAHGAGDLANAAIISRMLLAQGTKVDPVDGTVSTAENAVGPYEFLNDRILAAGDYFWQYMLGYDTPWVPVPYAISPDGTVRGLYYKLADSYRGRMNTAQFWDLYYYYTYVKGINLAEKAPYYYEAFKKRIPSNYYYKGTLQQAWESADGGGDFWLYIPKEAESEGASNLPKEQPSAALVEIEDRYTAFDGNSATKQEGSDSYVEFTATAQGSKIVVHNLSYADRTNSRLIGLKFRTNGIATVELSKEIGSKPYYTLTLPDTKGQWKYVTYDMGISRVSYGQLDSDYSLLYMTVKGDGTTVDVDHLNVKAGEQLTPPAFKTGSSDLKLVAFAGAPVTLDFSATDAGAADVVTYELSNMPQGAAFNANTGAFTWQPAQAGTVSFVVQASDGTTLATRSVSIAVAADRNTAVTAAASAYDPGASYTSASLIRYQTAYDTAMSQIGTAADDVFFAQLTDLKSAADGLQLLTPVLSDGTMDYSTIVKSTFGNSISLLVDGNNNTYPVYSLSPAPDLSHTLDFGPNYKITASAFAFQARMNFIDRGAGITIFGSNDGDTWTRITPGETAFSDDFSTIQVSDAYRNTAFRFIKMQMVHPQADVLHDLVMNLLELGEFRIYGERHEVDTKLESVSIGSDQSAGGKIAFGDTVKLTIKAKEAISGVKVKIQGLDAAVATQDNINWTATAAMNGVQAGKVAFAIDYQKKDGASGETTYLTTDDSKLFLVDRSAFLNVPMLAKVTASDVQFPGTGLSKEQVGYLLFDGNVNNYGDLNTGSGSYYTIDFGADATVKLNEILLMPRSNFPDRMNGLVVQGSNDNVNWTNLTTGAKGTQANVWTVITGSDMLNRNPYRYVRLYNSNGWFGNVAEVELYGDYAASAAALASRITSIPAPAKDAARLTLPQVPAGYTVAVKSAAPAGIIGTDGSIAKPAADTFVSVVLTVTKTADGTTADTSAIKTFVPGTAQASKINVSKLATVIASDKQFPGTGLSKEQVGYLLFDGSTATYGDLNTGSGSYYTIDFGASATIRMSGIKLMPRAAWSSRLNGLIVQGSNDNATWTNLTQAVAGAKENTWYEIASDKIANMNAYRYIRLFNGTAWYGNMAEVEIYGDYDFSAVAKVIAPDGYTKGSYYLYQKEIERINAAAIQPGADKAALLADLLQAEGLLVPASSIYPKIAVTSSMALAATGRDATSAAAMGWRAFDGDANTFPDTTIAAGWVQADLGEGSAKAVGIVRFIPRTGQSSRMNGALIQGSNDGVSFDTLYTISGVSDIKWYTQTISGSKAYRYLRYYTPSGFANVGELEFYEKIADRTLLALRLDQANAVIAGDYTEESYAALQTAVMNANAVNANAGAAQSDVDAAEVGLKTALNGLIYRIGAALDPAEPNGQGGWYTVPVAVTLSTAGIAEYKLSSEAAWQAYTAPIVLDQDGAYTVSFRSKKSDGTAGADQTVEVKMDKTAPVTTASVSPAEPSGRNGWYTSDVTVSLDAADATSGLAKTEYQVNDGPWMTYAGSIPAFGDGIYVVRYRSTDLAGNVEQTRTASFKVDKTAPELSVQLDQTSIWPANHTMVTIHAALKASDTGSGVESVALTSIASDQPDSGQGDIEADIGTEDTAFSLRAEKSRVYTITYTVTDKAGNQTSVTATVTVPHDQSEHS